MDGDVSQLKSMLLKSGKSITKQRFFVFNELSQSDKPLLLTELIRNLNDRVDKVSVYRTIDLFEKLGVVDRVWNGFKSRIELSDAFSPHHHHFTCVSCASTVGVESDEIETALQKLENSNGFSLTHHSIELRGFCENCK